MKNFIKHFKSGLWLKSPIFWARFFAYAIPLSFLLYVLYMNFLPFGYNKTFIISVGSKEDTDVSKEFHLEPSRSLSDATTSKDGSTYRKLNGIAYADFKPNAVLKNAKITVSVEGDGISIMPPVINFNPNTINWDYSWDFTKGIPKDFIGNAFMFDGEATFDGKGTRLELPNSVNKFENKALSIYVEWKPINSNDDAQQIVGHYNWELGQNKDNVEFRVGRMSDAKGPSYSLKYPVDTEFFNKKHSAIAIYNPSENGYIDLYVDGIFAGRTHFGPEKIWVGYGKENLSLGWTPFNYEKCPHLKGYVYRVSIVNNSILIPESTISYNLDESLDTAFLLISNSTSTLKRLKLHVF